MAAGQLLTLVPDDVAVPVAVRVPDGGVVPAGEEDRDATCVLVGVALREGVRDRLGVPEREAVADRLGVPLGDGGTALRVGVRVAEEDAGREALGVDDREGDAVAPSDLVRVLVPLDVGVAATDLVDVAVPVEEGVAAADRVGEPVLAGVPAGDEPDELQTGSVGNTSCQLVRAGRRIFAVVPAAAFCVPVLVVP